MTDHKIETPADVRALADRLDAFAETLPQAARASALAHIKHIRGVADQMETENA